MSYLFLFFCMFLLHRTDETFPAYCCKTVGKDWQSFCLVSYFSHSFIYLCFKWWFHIKRSLAIILAYKAHAWLLICHCTSWCYGFQRSVKPINPEGVQSSEIKCVACHLFTLISWFSSASPSLEKSGMELEKISAALPYSNLQKGGKDFKWE